MVTAEQAKQRLAAHGEVRPQPPGEWRGTFPIPPVVERFYGEVGPVDIFIEAYGNPYFLPSLAGLWNLQAGYRWDELIGKPIEDWNNDWLIVADKGGDPFVLSWRSGAVLHAYHGEAVSNASEMFPDLNTMAACLAEIGLVVLEAGDRFLDDHFVVRAVWRKRVYTRLRLLLGSVSAARNVFGLLGWDDVSG